MPPVPSLIALATVNLFSDWFEVYIIQGYKNSSSTLGTTQEITIAPLEVECFLLFSVLIFSCVLTEEFTENSSPVKQREGCGNS